MKSIKLNGVLSTTEVMMCRTVRAGGLESRSRWEVVETGHGLFQGITLAPEAISAIVYESSSPAGKQLLLNVAQYAISQASARCRSGLRFSGISCGVGWHLVGDVSGQHSSQALAKDQLDAQIFNTFITILYMYMFRAISCSASGGQIVLIQHLVSSLSVSDRPVHRTVTYWQWRYQMY